jgi:hypothetical protein
VNTSDLLSSHAYLLLLRKASNLQFSPEKSAIGSRKLICVISRGHSAGERERREREPFGNFNKPWAKA